MCLTGRNVHCDTQQPTGKCEALFDFQSKVSGELSFSPGEVITTTEWVNEDWMKGTIGEREGMFPVNFVKVLEELPKQEQHSVSGIAGPREAFWGYDLLVCIHAGTLSTFINCGTKIVVLTYPSLRLQNLLASSIHWKCYCCAWQ